MIRAAKRNTFATCFVLLCAPALFAATTPEQACQRARHAAAANYNACAQKAVGKIAAGGNFGKFRDAISKCRIKYTGTWAKLAAKAAGTGGTCDAGRFTDGGTTVTDNLTGLQWEKKTDDMTIHDKDTMYPWTAGTTAADGTVFTTFLPALNGGCFAGQCDWRLPTVYELQTIVLEAYPCTTSPCIDPVFGPTVADFYWSATTYATDPNDVWLVDFNSGVPDNGYKNFNDYVRAVRAGL